MEAHLNTNYYFKMIIPQRNWVSNKSGESSEDCIFYEMMGSETISTIN